MARASSKIIAVAVVRHGDCFLAGLRPEGVPLAGFWEFPGGKVEPLETPADAAVRECREEAGLDVRVVGEYPPVDFDYPHGSLHLRFFACVAVADGDESSCDSAIASRRDLPSPPLSSVRAVPSPVPSLVPPPMPAPMPAPAARGSLPFAKRPFIWIERQQLAKLEFPPANAAIVQWLTADCSVAHGSQPGADDSPAIHLVSSTSPTPSLPPSSPAKALPAAWSTEDAIARALPRSPIR